MSEETPAAAGGDPTDGARIGVIGAGVMGRALIAAVLAGGWPADRIEACEPDAGRAEALAAELGIAVGTDNAAAARRADVVLLAVKPQVVGHVLAELAGAVGPGALVVSVAAGVPLAVYERALGPGVPVVRVMPNTPAVVGKGVSAVAPGRHATGEHLDLVERMLAATGLVVRVPEHDLDAVTAVSGSGPAYVFYLIDAMAEAGVLLGLTRELSTRLAVGTVEGSAALVARTGEHPVVLRERVSSPGGTTVAAVRQLDAHGVRAGVLAAAQAAYDRSRELGAELG